MSVIDTRRSIRKYTAQSVAKHTIEQLIAAACLAPSARNQQPWDFLVVTDRQKLDAIPTVQHSCAFISQAPAAVIVCGDRHKNERFWPVDCAAATENLLLKAAELGLGSCWCAIYPLEQEMAGFKQLFGLPDQVEAFSLIVLGYPAEEKPQPDRDPAGHTHWEQW